MLTAAACMFLGWACADGDSDATVSSASSGPVTSASSSDNASGGAGGMGGAGSSNGGDSTGGFSPTTTGSGGAGGRCAPVLTATIRDFMASHEDFETYTGTGPTMGLVQLMLGADQKPVFLQSGGQITSAASFAQWYNDVNGVNQAFTIELALTETSPGVYSYIDNAFFPIDGQGWGNEGNTNNFHFTTEIHATFEYKGGEVFTFNGDDDLWMFINGRLAMDLGGLHPAVEGTVVLDSVSGLLNITPGNVYPMDIFHAERHTDQSNFRVDTTIDCFVPPPQ